MIDIALCTSRKQKNWKNKQITWEELVLKLSTTHRTVESYAQYMACTSERQGEIKDVGGFVGGYLKAGKRGKGTVKHRQIVTLDVDFGHAGFWDDFTLLYANTALIYSTHKHWPEAPRFRLVLPLSRPVNNEEYIAISRKIAGNLGINYFDSTTFQNERLMYWPSTSRDGEYVFESQEGSYLDADEVLSSYRDWTDMSEWPMCDNEKNIITSSVKKQEDPTTKKGLIGAFCRAFPISEAIDEFIPDIYISALSIGEGRYTYYEGSTAGGAIVYDDLYLYSHHNTDPAGGQLCNAFDLVRIHRYGHLDKDSTLPATKMESYKMMISQAAINARVLKEVGDFNDLPEGDWLADMEVDKNGLYLPTINNLWLIINNDENLKGGFARNEFENRDFAMRDFPWNAYDAVRTLNDADDCGLRHYLEKTYKIYQIQKTKDAADLAALNNSFHPVRAYLDKLEWDGKERVDNCS